MDKKIKADSTKNIFLFLFKLEKIFLLIPAVIIYFFLIKPDSQHNFNHFFKNKKHKTIFVQKNKNKKKIFHKNVNLSGKIKNFGNIIIFSDNQIQKQASKIILTAKKQIFGTTYTIGKCKITRTLDFMAKKGIKIDILAGKNKHNYSFDFNLKIARRKRGIMHTKFLVIDNKKVVLFSSNFTYGFSKNVAIFFPNAPQLAKTLKKEFEIIKIDSKTRICKKGCDFFAGKIFFSPGKACISVKRKLVKAKKEIVFGMYTLTLGTPMMTGMKKILKKRIKVYGIVDDWFSYYNGRKVNERATDLLKYFGAKINFDKLYLKNKPILFHPKFAIIDSKTVVFGSMNWTKSGCYNNREYTIIMKNKQIAKFLRNYILSLKRK